MSSAKQASAIVKLLDVRHKHAGTVAAGTATPVIFWGCYAMGYIPEPPILISLLAGVSVGALVGLLNSITSDEDTQ